VEVEGELREMREIEGGNDVVDYWGDEETYEGPFCHD